MFKESCESIESQTLYELNKELLLLKNTRNKGFIRKIKTFFSYLFQGYFRRIIAYFFEKRSDNSFNLKNYLSYPKKRVAVYTCLFGKYDKIHEPLFINPNVDYFIITDQDVSECSAWKKKELDNIFGTEKMSSIEKNRFLKIMPHLFLKDYDYSIYIDANRHCKSTCGSLRHIMLPV